MNKHFVSYFILIFLFSFSQTFPQDSFVFERKQVHIKTKTTLQTDTQNISTVTQEHTQSLTCNGNKYMVPLAAFVGGVVCGQLGKEVGKGAIDVLRSCLQFLYGS